MSVPIRPLPLEAAPQRTEDDAVSMSRENLAGFGEVLDLHLGEESDKATETDESRDSSAGSSDKDKAEVGAGEPWTILGAACFHLQVLQPQSVQGETDASSTGDPASALSIEKPASDNPAGQEADLAESEKDTVQGGKGPLELLDRLRGWQGEQKVPALATVAAEQIAANPPKTGEKAHGILAAKQPTMLLTSQTNDEKGSTKPSLLEPMRLEIQSFEATAFEQPVKIQEIYSKSDKASSPADKEVKMIEAAPLQILSHDTDSGSIAPEPEVHRASSVSVFGTLQSINGHVQLFRASNRNELQVVLRPDANTELFLHITKTDGQIHVQARCDRGDFAWLGAHWGAVQNSLSAQGVQVEALQPSPRLDNQAHSQFMGDRQEARRDASPEKADPAMEPRFSKPSRPSTPPSAPRPLVRGWQSWA